MTGAWSTTGTFAQNSPPKAESDCGVTSMCGTPQPPAVHHGTPLWATELLMFAVLAAVLVLAYRFLLGRGGGAG